MPLCFLFLRDPASLVDVTIRQRYYLRLGVEFAYLLEKPVSRTPSLGFLVGDPASANIAEAINQEFHMASLHVEAATIATVYQRARQEFVAFPNLFGVGANNSRGATVTGIECCGYHQDHQAIGSHSI